MDWTLREPALVELLTAFRQDDAPIYVVGGVVRDLLLGREPDHNDLDLVVAHDALTRARRVADRLGWAYYPMDEARDVARLIFAANSSKPIICDVAGMRGGSIEADLLSRDFTINAMALAFSRHGQPELIDICGGQADLQRRLVRRVSAVSLAEDAVRILRAVRLANQLDFEIEGATQTQMQRLAHTLRLVSPERVRDELWKLLAGPRAARGVEAMHALGVLAQVLPEVAATAGVTQGYPHYQDVFNHTLATMRYAVALRRWVLGEPVQNNPALGALDRTLGQFRFHLGRHLDTPTAAGRTYGDWLVFHALLHDIGKPATRTEEPEPVNLANEAAPAKHHVRVRFLGHEMVGAKLAEARLSAMRFSRFECELAEAVVAAHMRPHQLHAGFEDKPLSRRAIYRFFRDTGGRQAGVAVGIVTILLALADYQAIYPASPPPGWSAYLDHMADLLAFACAAPGEDPLPKPLLDGHTLMRHLHLKPGRQVGELLEFLREAQVAGEVSTPAEALHLAAGWLNQQND